MNRISLSRARYRYTTCIPDYVTSRLLTMELKRLCSSAVFLLLFCCAGTDCADKVQSKIISAVRDGAGGFKIVNNVGRGAVLRANFTNMINTTGSVKSSFSKS